jgi:hypothetical protein
MRTTPILPYGDIRKLAAFVGCSTTWASKVVHGKQKPGFDLALLFDASGMVPFSVLDLYYPRPVHLPTPSAA